MKEMGHIGGQIPLEMLIVRNINFQRIGIKAALSLVMLEVGCKGIAKSWSPSKFAVKKFMNKACST